MADRRHGVAQMNMSPASRRASGHAFPSRPVPKVGGANGGGAPPEDNGDDYVMVPVPIALSWSTIFKLVAPALLAIAGLIAAGAVFYSQTQAHLVNKVAHIGPMERERLETKEQARVARFVLFKRIEDSHAVKIREVKVEQREQIQKLGESLKAEQQKIFREVQRTRRALR